MCPLLYKIIHKTSVTTLMKDAPTIYISLYFSVHNDTFLKGYIASTQYALPQIIQAMLHMVVVVIVRSIMCSEVPKRLSQTILYFEVESVSKLHYKSLIMSPWNLVNLQDNVAGGTLLYQRLSTRSYVQEFHQRGPIIPDAEF